MTLLLVTWLVLVVAGFGLEAIELRHLARHGGAVPDELRDTVDAATLARTAAYTLARSRLRLVQSLVQSALVGWFVFGGGLAVYARWFVAPIYKGLIAHSLTTVEVGTPGGMASLAAARSQLGLSAQLTEVLSQAIGFGLGLLVAETLLAIPFSLWSDFRIEAQHGFNRTTARLWLTDQLKTLAISLVLATVVMTVVTGLVWRFPHTWWLWAWSFGVAFALLLLYLSPVLLEPLFFKFKPVTAPELESRIRGLAAQAGLRLGRIQQVDASRRSAHSNAYFTGIGRVKRIVLFDTLLQAMQPDEVLAVLAHEIGHWRLQHVRRRLLAMAGLGLAATWAASLLLRWPGLPGLAGMASAAFPARVALVAFLASLAALPSAPLANALSRRDEWQADRYAVRLTGRPADLAGALAKLARDNLANLHPQPLYAWFFYSHPPVVARIRALHVARPPGGGA